MTTERNAVTTDDKTAAAAIAGSDELADALLDCTADTFALAVKTQAFHWNCEGPLFVSLHNLTEEHYQDLFAAVDDMAERVRALGAKAPVSASEMLVRSDIAEETEIPDSVGMIATLREDHECAAQRCREAASRADSAGDVATADMLTARTAFHEKASWMLTALAA